MERKRNISKAKFQNACLQHGFKKHFGGMYDINFPDEPILIWVAQAGCRRKSQLEYLKKAKYTRKGLQKEGSTGLSYPRTK